MKVLLVLLLLQSSYSLAETKKAKQDMSALGKIDEESINNMEATKPAVTPVPTGSKLSMSCKDSIGKVFKQGEAGYDDCLAGIKTQHDMKKLNSGVNKKDDQSGNAASFDFKIGD